MTALAASWLPPAALAGAIGVRFWLWAAHGFDLTDEGIYLNWMARPAAWPFGGTLFAPLIHPLWLIVGQDVVALRRLSAIIMVALGCAPFAALFTRLWRLRLGVLWALPLGVLSLSGIFSNALLVTPGYDVLCLDGYLLAATSLILLTPSDLHGPSRWGWPLLGVAGSVVFAARPGSAAVLLIVSVVYVVAVVPGLPRRLGAWLGPAATLLTAVLCLLGLGLLLGVGPRGLITRVQRGIDLHAIQTGKDMRWLIVNLVTAPNEWSRRDQVLGLAIALAALVSVSLLRRWASVIVGLAATACAVLAGFTALGSHHHLLGEPLTRCLIAAPVAVGIAIAGGTRRRLGLALAMAVMPFAEAFTTINSTLGLASTASILWFLAALVLLAPSGGRDPRPALATASGAALLCCSLTLQSNVWFPARQAPLAKQQVALPAGTPLADLRVSADMARYIGWARDAAASAGLTAGTPVLDLTGESPGLLYALGADPVADPWVVGGYVGSEARLHTELRWVNCSQLSRAWLLTSDDGPRRIDPTVLEQSGLDAALDWTPVATGVAPQTSASYHVTLRRPLHPSAMLTACEGRR